MRDRKLRLSVRQLLGDPSLGETRPSSAAPSVRPDLPPGTTTGPGAAHGAETSLVVPQVVVESGHDDQGEGAATGLHLDLRVLLAGLRRRRLLMGTIVLVMTGLSLTAALLARQHQWRVLATVLRKSEQKEYLVTGTQPIVMLQTYTMPTLLRLVKTTANLERAASEAGLEQVEPAELSAAVVVNNPRDTEIIEIILDWPDPTEAVAVVNALARAYVELVDRLQKAEAVEAHFYLSGELATVRERLARAEAELVQFKEEHGVVELSAQTGHLLQQIAEVDLLASKERLDAEMAQRALEQAEAEIEQQAPTLVASTFVKHPVRARLVELEAERAEALSVYTEEAPRVRELSDEIGRVEDLVRRGVEEQLAEQTLSRNPVVGSLEQAVVDRRVEAVSRAARADGYERVLATLRQRLQELPELESRLADTSQRVRSLREVEATLTSRVEEVRLIRDSTAANLAITQGAIRPRYPLPSKAKLILGGGVFLGLVLAGAVGLGLELADTSLKSIAEVEWALAVPPLAEVPILRSEQVLLVGASISPALELFRYLAADLLGQRRDQAGWVLMVAGAAHFEGRTTIALNLARVAAARGLRVCVVDTDLRKPNLDVLAPRFGVVLGASGLKQVLRNQAELSDALVEVGPTGPIWLPSGPGEVEPELLASERMADLLTQLRRDFDLILVDTVPVLAATDAVLLARAVDAVLVVAEACALPRAAHREVVARLQGTGASLVGAVLNKVPPEFMQPWTPYRVSSGGSGS